MQLNQLDEVKTELVTDGIYGPITTSAVGQFQSAHPPLKATGTADGETQAAIAEAMTEDQNQEDIGRKLFALGAGPRAGQVRARLRLLHARRRARRPPRDRVLARPVAAQARWSSRGGDRALRAVPRDRTRHARRGCQGRARRAQDAGQDRRRRGRHRVAGASSTRAAHSSRRATTATPTTSSRRPESSSDRAGILFSRAQSLRKLGGRREEAIALYEQYLARSDGTRKKDAEAALAELRAPEATGDETKDTATAKGIFNKGGALFEAGDYGHAYASSRRPESSPTAPASSSHAPSHCASSAVARRRRWRSTSSTSTWARAAGSKTPSGCSSCSQTHGAAP